MSPFDPDYRGLIAEEMASRRGRAAASRSAIAIRARERQRTSEDAAMRLHASATVPGLGQRTDEAKQARIRKPSRI
ncbi:hypothetical protein CKO44_07710 [Rubrivivax gelatinosus]|uniref:hypothetical protein n=1 Tax=Rubrivivax gelatinosus TaxID=28068 RepID=UPI0019067903|nr:hypothetical protein [Rubrivivax gelatinosus]MBK1613355.1 hypothetical protein [Rubrivivax gelatinosus]MBZ8143396.1 hypothetical protein [Rubrivivax gelatinosus]